MPDNTTTILKQTSLSYLKEKADWLRLETLILHQRAPGTRVASALSCIEVLTVLYYADLLQHDPSDPRHPLRDRVIPSKGHGLMCLYPILSDLGYFPADELDKIGEDGALLTIIPEPSIPGIETINGSLGHGLGVACGMALALKRKGVDRHVYCICGDGELNEGAVWEAIMFAGHHHLDNLVLIVDDNKVSMLGFQETILNLQPLEDKFAAFDWESQTVNGHDLSQVFNCLSNFKSSTKNAPKVMIAETQKGRGVPWLVEDPLCHVKTLKSAEIDDIIRRAHDSK